MTINKQFLLSALLCLISYSSTSLATGPRVAPSLFVSNTNQLHALELPPFVSHTSKNHGVLYELIDSIIKTEQIAAEINVLPSLNMAKYYFSQEDALAMIGHDFNLNKENQKKAVFIPVLAIDEYYFYYASNTDKPLNWTGKLSAFKDKTYGATKGENVQVYKKAGIHIKYARLPALLKKMQQQQVDFIREPELTVDTLIEHTLPKEKNAVIKMQPKAGKMLLGIVFNKNHKNGKQAAKQFKAGLKKMIRNGQFEAVLQKHLGSDAKMKDYVNFSD